MGGFLRLADRRRRDDGLARRDRRRDRLFRQPRRARNLGAAWSHAIGNLVVLVLATLNMLVHTHDAWTSVVPWGLTLSALTVVLLLFTGWMGWAMVYRYRVGGAPMKPLRLNRAALLSGLRLGC